MVMVIMTVVGLSSLSRDGFESVLLLSSILESREILHEILSTMKPSAKLLAQLSANIDAKQIENTFMYAGFADIKLNSQQEHIFVRLSTISFPIPISIHFSHPHYHPFVITIINTITISVTITITIIITITITITITIIISSTITIIDTITISFTITRLKDVVQRGLLLHHRRVHVFHQPQRQVRLQPLHHHLCGDCYRMMRMARMWRWPTRIPSSIMNETP